MIGNMIAKVRKEKGVTKTELARLTDINIGHLTHIEKGERNPSHKALRNICKALDIPYQQLAYTYDKQFNEDQEKYGMANFIPYNKILAVDNCDNLIDCPSNVATASIAIKVKDDSMTPYLENGDYAYIEFNSPLNNKDIGIFKLNDKILIRRFLSKKGKITLKAEDKAIDDIIVNLEDEFYIIGKVLIK